MSPCMQLSSQLEYAVTITVATAGGGQACHLAVYSQPSAGLASHLLHPSSQPSSTFCYTHPTGAALTLAQPSVL